MVLLACLLLLAVGGDDRSPLASGDVREVIVSAPAEASVEHFVLNRDGVEGPYAVARFVRWPLARGGERLELETRFLGSSHVVSHVERIEPGRRLLSWRERSPRGLRSVFLDGADGALTGWIGEGRRRVRLEVPAQVVLPLEWLGDALEGRARTGALEVFDPLGGGPRDVRVEGEPEAARWTWCEEGRACERYEVADGVLAGYSWRSNHVRARRISAAEYAERLAKSSS